MVRKCPVCGRSVKRKVMEQADGRSRSLLVCKCGHGEQAENHQSATSQPYVNSEGPVLLDSTGAFCITSDIQRRPPIDFEASVFRYLYLAAGVGLLIVGGLVGKLIGVALLLRWYAVAKPKKTLVVAEVHEILERPHFIIAKITAVDIKKPFVLVEILEDVDVSTGLLIRGEFKEDSSQHLSFDNIGNIESFVHARTSRADEAVAIASKL